MPVPFGRPPSARSPSPGNTGQQHEAACRHVSVRPTSAPRRKTTFRSQRSRNTSAMGSKAMRISAAHNRPRSGDRNREVPSCPASRRCPSGASSCPARCRIPARCRKALSNSRMSTNCVKKAERPRQQTARGKGKVEGGKRKAERAHQNGITEIRRRAIGQLPFRDYFSSSHLPPSPSAFSLNAST